VTATNGYFPRGTSMLRRVHEQRAVGLMYGQRALGIGAIAPLNFVGTRLHSRSLDRPFHRLAHTGKAFETVFFGSRAEADRVLGFVERLHDDVRGELPAAAGPVPAGTPYSAFDPELMLWTVAVMADSAQYFYELFVARLTPDQRDALWRDYICFGELFGMPREVAPRSYADFRSWWEAELASDGVHLTEEARQVGSAIMFEIPVPSSRRLAMQVHNLVMLGSLPARVRELYGLRWTRAQAAAFRATVGGLRATRPLSPQAARVGRNTRSFDLVAATERERIARGETVPGAL
jgi:uncharacterized protein (DUF2236 family)